MKAIFFSRPCALILSAALIHLLFGHSALALIEVAPGNEPVENRGWPTGSEAVANLESRLGYWEGPPLGGGEYHFEFQAAKTEDFNRALAVFSGIRAPELRVVVHDGPHRSTFLTTGSGNEAARVDWEFVIWIPRSWHRLFNDPASPAFRDHPNRGQPVEPPTIHAYVGGGGIVWAEVTVPGNVTVIDRRVESAPIPGIDSGVIAGSVYDIATGQVIAGARISVVPASGAEANAGRLPNASSGADGAFVLSGIPAGNHYVEARAPGYAPRRLAGLFSNPGKAFQKETVYLSAASELSGRVTDPSGNPLEGIRIRVSETLGIDGRGYTPPDEEETRTDSEGRFRIASLPEGITQLRARAEGLYRAGDYFEFEEIPSEDVALVMVRTGIIRGQVEPRNRDSVSSVHIEDARGAAIGRWGGSMQVDAEGRFEFKGVPPGEYLVSTRPLHIGPDPNAQRVTVAGGDTIEVRLKAD